MSLREWQVRGRFPADLLTYTFHLRPEARWSNGRPIVADDFNRRGRDQVVEFIPCRLIAETPGQNHRRLLQADSRQTHLLKREPMLERFRFSFQEQNCDQRRRIDRDHTGRPFSS